MKTVLTIAGSDSCAGAGIQADLKTMAANGVYGTCAVTALTAQNTMGVSDILIVDADFLEKQIESVLSDIPADAVKIGMLPSQAHAEVVVRLLLKYGAGNIVLDPVMVSSSGRRLMEEEAVTYLEKELFPICTLITPNIPEAEVLLGRRIDSRDDMEKGAKTLADKYGCSVLLKGGHLVERAESGSDGVEALFHGTGAGNGSTYSVDVGEELSHSTNAGDELSHSRETASENITKTAPDVLCHEGRITWFEGARVDSTSTHGTGCTLSSAIASNLAKDDDLESAVSKAKDYLTAAIANSEKIGHGHGPMTHIF